MLLLIAVMLLSVSGVKAATYYIKNAAPNVLSNWGTNTDGTGTAPKGFTISGDIFIIPSGRNVTTSANWLIGATGSTWELRVLGSLTVSHQITLQARRNGQGSNTTLNVNGTTGKIIFATNGKIIGSTFAPIPGKFNLNTGSSLVTNNGNGITGTTASIDPTNLTVTLSTGANYEFNGTTNQSTLGMPSTANNLIINNSAVVTLNQTNITTTTTTINAGKKFTLNSGQTLNATTFNILSDANGTGTFVNNGTANITNANVQQYLSSARNWYMSTPVNTGKIPTAGFKYNETVATNFWEAATSGATMTNGKGYIVIPSAAGTVTFSGALNDGANSIALTRTSTASRPGYNLVGNPYPSNISWTEAMATAANTLATIWYRTYNSGYAFQTYNAAVGIGVPFGTTGLISPMQAFWVKVNEGGGTLSFNNTMRSHSTSANPLKAPAAANSDLKLLRLEVTNGVQSDETVIYAHVNALDEIDMYDSPKMINGSTSIAPDIYTRIGTEQLVINGMNEIPYDTEIPLYFAANASVGSTFTITAKQFSNFEEGTQVWIKNDLSGISQIISDGATFNFDLNETGTNPKLSIIIKAPEAATQLSNTNNNNLVAFANANNQISVTCNDAISADATVTVHNSLGQFIVSKALTENVTLIDNSMISGVYMVTVINAGNKTTKKIIVK